MILTHHLAQSLRPFEETAASGHLKLLFSVARHPNRLLFGFSLVATSILSALLVVWKENDAVLKAWMKSFLGHHWTTHALLVLAIFVVLGLALAQFEPAKSGRPAGDALATAIAVAVIVSGLIVAGFFLLH